MNDNLSAPPTPDAKLQQQNVFFFDTLYCEHNIIEIEHFYDINTLAITNQILRTLFLLLETQ